MGWQLRARMQSTPDSGLLTQLGCKYSRDGISTSDTCQTVFLLHGMCPWISSWPSVELRRNYHEGKREQDNVSEMKEAL